MWLSYGEVFDHTIVQLNRKFIVHPMIQDPLTVSHQHSEKRTFDRELNTQREDCIFSDAVLFLSRFEHYFRLDHSTQESPKACCCIPDAFFSQASFSTCFKASSLSDLTCKEEYLARMTARKCSTSFKRRPLRGTTRQKQFATGSSPSQHRDVAVGFFESDTRIIERA